MGYTNPVRGYDFTRSLLLTMKVLKVKDLEVVLGQEKILSDLSFEVEKGEVLTILGPNGAGKSTLLKALLGIVPSSGEVEWGKEIDVAYLPEDISRDKFSILPISVRDLFKLKNVDDPNLDRVGLDSSFLDRSPANLSSGEFQRVFLAWTLAESPDVLLLDEPMEGIDAGGKETIYSLLHSFWEEKKLTILLITHDLSVVYAHSDNVLCLSTRSLCYGSPKKVLTPDKLREMYGHDIKFYGH